MTTTTAVTLWRMRKSDEAVADEADAPSRVVAK